MAFLTISITPGLSKKEHRRAARIGPRSVASTRPVDELMVSAGFEDVKVDDVTSDFLATARAWLDGYTRHEERLRDLIGEEMFDDLDKNRRDLISGIEGGLLRRWFASGVKPDRV